MVRLAVNQTGAGSSPAGAAETEGRANRRWHPPGERARRKPLQVQVLSLPLTAKDVLLGEQPASKTGAEGSTPSALARVSVAEQPRHHLAEVGRRVRLPPDTLPPCDAAGVATCLSSRRDGFESRTGRLLRAEAERRGDRLIRGYGQVRLLPARLTGEWTGAVPAGPHEPSEAGSTPASQTSRGSVEQPGVLAALTSRRPLVQIQPGLLTATTVAQRRRHLPDVEGSAGSSPAGGTAEWTGAWLPAWSHKPFPRRFESGLRNFVVWRCYGGTPPW